MCLGCKAGQKSVGNVQQLHVLKPFLGCDNSEAVTGNAYVDAVQL